MMFEKLSESSGNVIGYKASGKLTAADYEKLVPEVEALVRQEGNIRILMDLEEFEGEEVKARASDLKFGHEFRKNIDKMAFVGDKRWEKLMAPLAKLSMHMKPNISTPRIWIQPGHGYEKNNQ